MPIAFDNIPTTLRVPFAYIEFNNSNAQQGPSVQPYKSLMFGQKLAAGTATVEEIIQISDDAQAATLFGFGSMLHRMVRTYRKNDKVTPLFVIAQDDDGSAVAAAETLTFSGPATADGTLSVYIGGTKVSIAVSSGDTADEMAAALDVAINAIQDLLVTSTVATNVVTATARNKGLVGNEIDYRTNLFDDDVVPAGVGVAFAQSVAGATNPDLTASIAALPSDQYNFIAMPYLDTANLLLLKAELDDRFGPIEQTDGRAVAANNDTFGNLTTFGEARNDKHLTVIDALGPTPAFAWAAAYQAQLAKAAQADPARPFQTLELADVYAESKSEEFTHAERNSLLFSGVSTHKVAPGGVPVIERAITTYRLNTAGGSDTSYLNVNTLTTLSFIRYDFRTSILNKYPRHKLANDGTNFGVGQVVMTPSQGRAFALEKFDQWELAGYVEGREQFKRDLIVERNAADVDRLDFLLPPDLINQFRISGTQVQFLL